MNVDRSKTGLAKRIWLLLLKEGGRWRTAEISEALSELPYVVTQALYPLERRESVKRYEKPGKGQFVAWGITPGCKVPQGVSLADLLECDLAPLVEAKPC